MRDFCHRPTRLGDIFVARGWATPEQVDAAIQVQKQDGGFLGMILLRMGVVSREQMSEALREQRQQIPEIGPDELKALSPDVAKLIPEGLARRYNVIALKGGDEQGMVLAMEDPTDLAAMDVLSRNIGVRFDAVKAPGAAIALAVESCYGEQLGLADGGSGETLEDILEVERTETVIEREQTAIDLVAIAEETPVVRFVERLFRDATLKRASDIHLEPGDDTMSVRLRVDGVLQKLVTVPARMHPAVVSRIKILSGLNIAERRLPQDGRCRLKLGDREVDIRVSTLPTVHGEKVVMRLLDKGQSNLDLEAFGFGELDLERFKAALHASYGMILLSGPTGSGKTTSLYGGLSFLNHPSTNIVTVEDPVEYELAGITQVQIKPDIGLDFARCLRHILRQDPNVIMIGEMRDLDTTQIAVRAALTGHLVLSTLHANNAPAVVSRLVDIGIPRFLITASLNLAVAQRLLRRLCSECKAPFQPVEEALAKLGDHEGLADGTFYRPVGCAECDYIGYRGRVGLYELMPVSKRLKQMILDDASENELRAAAREDGMRTLYEQAVDKVIAGLTSIEEVLSSPSDD